MIKMFNKIKIAIIESNNNELLPKNVTDYLNDNKISYRLSWMYDIPHYTIIANNSYIKEIKHMIKNTGWTIKIIGN